MWENPRECERIRMNEIIRDNPKESNRIRKNQKKSHRIQKNPSESERISEEFEKIRENSKKILK